MKSSVKGGERTVEIQVKFFGRRPFAKKDKGDKDKGDIETFQGEGTVVAKLDGSSLKIKSVNASATSRGRPLRDSEIESIRKGLSDRMSNVTVEQ